MRIVHLSYSDIDGGAALAAHRLNTGLRRIGHGSQMLVARRDGDDPSVLQFAPPRDLPHRLAARARQLWLDESFRRPYRRLRRPGHSLGDCRTTLTTLAGHLPATDVVHLHWVAFLLDWPSFFRSLPPDMPIVWTLHDENPFTGGCHYTGSCRGFTGSCGHCPVLTAPGPHDLSHVGWRRKHRALQPVRSHRLHVVTPSRWLADQARASSLLGRFPVSAVPNGVDVLRFSPVPRDTARGALGIPDDGRALALFVATDLGVGRKGFPTLCRALDALPGDAPLRLLSVGTDPATEAPRIPHTNLGALPFGSERVALAYAAADFLVVPSIEDNLPNTVLESFACGVPVVASAVGGIPAVVTPGVTGLLVPPGDAGALAAAIGALLTDPARRAAMGEAARRLAVEEYSLERIAQRYVQVYRTLSEAP